MTDNLDEKIDKYREDIIPIFDFIADNYLRLKRVKTGKGGKYQTLIFIDDDSLNTSINLGFYYDGKWFFENPNNASLFWRLIRKNHRSRIYLNTICRMKQYDNLTDSMIVRQLKMNDLKRKFRRFVNKFKNK